MVDNDKINEIIKKFAFEMKNIFKNNLIEIILFGSYAKGNAEYGSDIDIMLLVDIDKSIIPQYRRIVGDVVFNIGIDYIVLFSPIIQNYYEFQQYKDASGFFKNIIREGVKISA